MNNKKRIIKEAIKKHIPKHHLSSLRIMYRVFMETIYCIKRTGLMNLFIVAAMAAILTIFGTLFRTSLSLTSFVDKLGNAFEISVYLKPETNPENIKTSIKDIEHVKNISIISKEQAWKEMSSEIDLEGLDKNILPDTLHITIDDPKNIPEVCNNIKNLSGIEDLSYAQEFAEKLQTITNVFNTVTIFVLIAVAVLTIIIINSTIQLVIHSRKEEIEIMRLMGVSNWYIKMPLILQGAIYGFIGAVISLLPLNLVQNVLVKLHSFLMVSIPGFSMTIVIVCLFGIAIFFGASGSLLSIKKHLQV